LASFVSITETLLSTINIATKILSSQDVSTNTNANNGDAFFALLIRRRYSRSSIFDACKTKRFLVAANRMPVGSVAKLRAQVDYEPYNGIWGCLLSLRLKTTSPTQLVHFAPLELVRDI